MTNASGSLLLACLVLLLLLLSSSTRRLRSHGGRAIVRGWSPQNKTSTWTSSKTSQSHHHLFLRGGRRNNSTAPAINAKIYYRDNTTEGRRLHNAAHPRDLSTAFTSYFEPQITTTVMPDTVNQLGTGYNEVFKIQHTIEGASDADLASVPFEVVFAIDTSYDMSTNSQYDPTGNRLYQCKNFIDKLDPLHDRVAAVSWNKVIKSSKPLSNNFGAIRSEIDKYFTHRQYTSDLDVGLAKAVQILDASTWTDSIKAVVFVTNGYNDYTFSNNNDGPTKQAKAKGYRIYPIGLLSSNSTLKGLVEARLIDMGTSTNEGKWYSRTGSASLALPFLEAYSDMMDLVDRKCPSNVDVTEILASGIDLDVASVSPTPTSIANDQRTILWKNLESFPYGPYFCGGARPALNLTYSARSATAGSLVKVSGPVIFEYQASYCESTCEEKQHYLGGEYIDVIPTTMNLSLAVASNLTGDACVSLGTVIDYELNYTNSGNTLLHGVVVRSTVSPHLEVKPGHGGVYSIPSRTVSWAIGTLPPAANGTKHLFTKLVSRANEPNGAPNFTNVAELYSTEVPVPVVEEEEATACPPNLTLAIDDGLGDDACISDPNGTTFFLNFTNLDSYSERANITLIANLSSQVVYHSASNGGTYNHTRREIEWTIGSLAPNAEGFRSFSVNFTSNATFLLTSASITSIEGNATHAQLNTSVCLPPDWKTYVNLPPVAQCKDVVEAADDECLVHVAPHLVDGGCYDPESATLLSSTSISNCTLGTTAVTLSISDGQLGDECEAKVTVEDWTPPPSPSVQTSTYYLWPPTQELFAIYNVSSIHGDSVDNCSGENITTSFVGCTTTDHQGTLELDCFYEADTDTLFVRAEQLTVYRQRRLKSGKNTKASKASSKGKSQKSSKATTSLRPTLPRPRPQPRPPAPTRPRIEPVHTYHVRLDLSDQAGNVRATTFIVQAPHNEQEVKNLGLDQFQRLDTSTGSIEPTAIAESRNRRRRHYRTQANSLF